MFHSGGQTNKYDESNRLFTQFFYLSKKTRDDHSRNQRDSNPILPAMKRLHIYALDRTATGTWRHPPVCLPRRYNPS